MAKLPFPQERLRENIVLLAVLMGLLLVAPWLGTALHPDWAEWDSFDYLAERIIGVAGLVPLVAFWRERRWGAAGLILNLVLLLALQLFRSIGHLTSGWAWVPILLLAVLLFLYGRYIRTLWPFLR